MYVVCGAVLYSLYYSVLLSEFVQTKLGLLTTGVTSFVDIDDNGINLIVVDGVAGFTYTFSNATFAQITDSSFPNGATTVAFIDGRFIGNLPNAKSAYISASYDGTTWTPALFFSKENEPDYLLAVDTVAGLIILWGAATTEFWQDVGNSPVPYSRINGATAIWGLAALWSRVELVNPTNSNMAAIIALCSSQTGGTAQVVIFNGYTPTVVSTSDVENLINGFATYSDAVALSYVVDGHVMYQITFPTAGHSFLYDLTTNQWQEVQTGAAHTARHYCNLSIVYNNQTYMSDYIASNMYQLSPSTYTDNGNTIKRELTSRHINNGGREFGIQGVQLVMETGVGLQYGQGKNPQIMLQTSKDQGRTFGTERWTSLGMVGQYRSPRVYWRNLGRARDFVFKFRMTDPVKFTVVAQYIESNDLGL